jgi:Mrp family chromosome partitioning ATPase
MKTAIVDEQFDALRSKIEAAVETPSVILVSSACAGDGKSVTAYGLAASFSASGYRTALIDANHLSPTLGDERGPVSLEQFAGSGPVNFARGSSDGSFGVISLINDSVRRNASRPTLARAVNACRESYEILIIDTAPLGDSSLAMMLANQADAIILAVREGRAIKRADHDLIKSIDASGLPTLGTVTIDPKMIAEFKASLDGRRASVTTLTTVEALARARTAAS